MESIRDFLFGGATRQIVYKSLEAGALRSRVIAQNLANSMTPGYRRKEVHFEEQLRRAMEVKVPGEETREGHLPIEKGLRLDKVKPFVYEAQDPTRPGEINNVDIDMEAAKLAENQLLYNYAIRFAGFKGINSAISGRPSE